MPDSEFGEDGGSFYTGTINNTSGQHVQIYFEEDDVAYWFTKRTVACWMRYEAYGQIGKKADSKASGAASGADGGAKAATASSSGGAALDMDLDDFEIAEFETADQLHSASSPLVGAKAMAAATTTNAAAARPEAKGDAYDDAVEEQGAPAPAAEAHDGGDGGNGGYGGGKPGGGASMVMARQSLERPHERPRDDSEEPRHSSTAAQTHTIVPSPKTERAAAGGRSVVVSGQQRADGASL